MLRSIREDDYVVDGEDKLMVCKHGKEVCAACKVDHSLGNMHCSGAQKRIDNDLRAQQDANDGK